MTVETVVKIEPHTAEGKVTDIAGTALYSAIVSTINSERTLVWQRYQSLLLANSIVFGFVGGSTLSEARLLIIGVFGLGLCYCWWILTLDGWRFFDLYSRIARRFCWPAIGDSVNPVEEMYAEFERRKQASSKSFGLYRFCEGDTIKAAALGVVIMFATAYLVLIGLVSLSATKIYVH